MRKFAETRESSRKTRPYRADRQYTTVYAARSIHAPAPLADTIPRGYKEESPMQKQQSESVPFPQHLMAAPSLPDGSRRAADAR
jgi:hypothetical protein